MGELKIQAGAYQFEAKLEEALAPRTCATFLSLLPYKQKIIHVRWSGEACWIPLGELDLGLTFENHTSFPAPAKSLFIQAASAKRKFYSPTAAFTLRARSASLRVITF